jgi:hemolysin III
LIAGTNTPLIVTLLGRTWRRWFLWGMWTLAMAGAACMWILSKPPHEAIIVICMGMGLLGLLPSAHYYRAVGWRAMNWVLVGCTLYAIGAVCELAKWPILSDFPVRVGYHEVFHPSTRRRALCSSCSSHATLSPSDRCQWQWSSSH